MNDRTVQVDLGSLRTRQIEYLRARLGDISDADEHGRVVAVIAALERRSLSGGAPPTAGGAPGRAAGRSEAARPPRH